MIFETFKIAAIVTLLTLVLGYLFALPLPPLSFQVNNRKLIQGFYPGLGIADVTGAIRVIDKLDKLPADEVRRVPGPWSAADLRRRTRLCDPSVLQQDDPIRERPRLGEGQALRQRPRRSRRRAW